MTDEEIAAIDSIESEVDRTLPDALRAQTRVVLERHWQPEGYTVPNGDVYPHQWLWDSCFHAIIWAHLGEPERAVAELTNVFARQADDGFVPHMTYWRAPEMHASFWGRSGTSCITQPPMYGHAIAELARLGVAVDRSIIDAAQAGLAFLLDRREATAEGLVPILHPWESGCDDSPRWDAWCPGGYDPERWRVTKGELVAAVRIDPVSGSPVGSERFAVGSVGFNALVAFNARELASVAPAGGVVPDRVESLVEALRSSWDGARATFVDAGGHTSATVRTLEALLAVLVLDAPAHAEIVRAVFAELGSAGAFAGACGPAQVHRSEAAFDPHRYWRGPAWPQLTYLAWVAARRLGLEADARALAGSMAIGAQRSGLAEYWHPDTGEGFGAVPQSWTGLAAVMVPVR